MFTECASCNALTEVEKQTPGGAVYCEKCSNAIPSCEECLNKGSDCSKCSSGFTLFQNTEGRNVCVDCTKPEYYLRTTQTPQCNSPCCLCSVAIKNCVQCNGQVGVCSKCEDGFYLFSSRNNGVFDSCVPCKAPNQIQNAKILASTGQIACEVCSARIPNCNACFGIAYICQACEMGYYRTSSKRDGIYDTCTKCTDEGVYPVGDANGIGYCKYCNDLIPGCKSCDGVLCKSCSDPLYLSLPLKDSCVECLGQEESRRIDYESSLTMCYPRPVASEIMGFVSKDLSMASISLSCSEGGFVYFAIGKDNEFVNSLNYSSIRGLSKDYTATSAINITALTNTIYLKSSLVKAPYKLDVSVLGLNLREDYTVKQYCVNQADVESQTSLFVYSTANIPDEDVRPKATPLSQGLVWGLVVGLLVTLLLIFCILLGTQYTRSKNELKLLATEERHSSII